MAMAPNYKHQVWKDPDANDDDVVVPAMAGDSSDDELGMDDAMLPVLPRPMCLTQMMS